MNQTSETTTLSIRVEAATVTLDLGGTTKILIPLDVVRRVSAYLAANLPGLNPPAQPQPPGGLS